MKHLGFLVVNGFLKAESFDELYGFLYDAANRHDITLLPRRNCDLPIDASNGRPLFADDKPDFILFWDKDIRLAQQLEAMGHTLYNPSRAIALCDDKALTHIALSHEGVPMPKTIVAPMTFANIGYTNYDFVDRVSDELGLPLVIKECFGSFGQQVYLAHTRSEIVNILKSRAGVPLLFQEFVATSAGRDIRVIVVGGKVVSAIRRVNETGDFRANISNGGRAMPHTPTREEAELALCVCEKLGAAFGGVDLLFGADDRPLLCEVNSNAHFKGILTCTGVNVADAILAFIASQTP